jgi:hypothetical protein
MFTSVPSGVRDHAGGRLPMEVVENADQTFLVETRPGVLQERCDGVGLIVESPRGAADSVERRL